MADDMDLYVSIAANLEESQWTKILGSLDAAVLAKVKKGLDALKPAADMPATETPDDPAEALKVISEKLDKIGRALRSHRKRFEKMDVRLRIMEESGVGGGGGGGGYAGAASTVVSPKPSRRGGGKKKKGGGGKKKPVESVADKSRRHFYRFGSRNLQVTLPSEGYPAHKDAKVPPKAKLVLTYAHGYNGNSEDARQNLILTPDGKYLIYFIAAVCIRHDIEAKTQEFFMLHNDDITTICADPSEGSTLIASGQKDPKDEPGEGKDLPKIWIWDYATMKKKKLIDDVCWGKVQRLQWSKSGYLYCICGDEEQTLKVWHKDQFSKKGQPPELYRGPTTKEALLGLQINPYPSGKFVDEFVVFGKKKFSYGVISKAKGDKLGYKAKAVPISSIKKDGEKAFLAVAFLPSGHYAIGGASGAVYICKGSAPLGFVQAHEKALGDLLFDGKGLITAGMDEKIKRWAVAKELAKGKKMLQEKTKATVTVAGSDFIMQPRAIAYDKEKDRAYIGTKTNQIAAFEMKEEDASIVIDGHDGQIWGLCTHPEDNMYCTGGYDNAVKLWNADTLECVNTHEFELPDGQKKGHEITCAAWSDDGQYIAFGSEDSYVFVFSYEPFKLQFKYQIPPKSKNAELEGVAYLRFSDDSTMLGCAHMDSNLYIFSVEPGQGGSVILQQWDPLPHIAAPTNIQFSADGSMIKSLTRDYEVAHWHLNAVTRKGKFSPQIPDPDKLKWGGDPLIAGWDVEGLYQSGWDGTDLNDATLTADGKFVASGDDYGKVRLHPYPAIAPEANKCYGGHAEFVVGVEFLRDDSQLITCGGNDMAIFQWQLIKEEQDDE